MFFTLSNDLGSVFAKLVSNRRVRADQPPRMPSRAAIPKAHPGRRKKNTAVAPRPASTERAIRPGVFMLSYFGAVFATPARRSATYFWICRAMFRTAFLFLSRSNFLGKKGLILM